MPAWGTPSDADHNEDSWKLVLFIRHLPQLTVEEEQQMEKLNPKSPEELQEEKQEEQFLKGMVELCSRRCYDGHGIPDSEWTR